MWERVRVRGDLVVRNIRLTIEYDGTNYNGWQMQRLGGKNRNNVKTIQETIQDALNKILQEDVKLLASGRTDSGVHALGQVANFRTNSNIHPKVIQKALNSLLPPDIAIVNAKEIHKEFHATYDAKSKLYRYTICPLPFPHPLNRFYAYTVYHPLDIALMRQEAKVLIGRHNFKSFQARDKKEKNTVRTIKKLVIKPDKEFIHIDIEADGFLYNMVRNIVGTLIEIGRGKLGKGVLKKILEAKDRRLAGPTAPAKGLCLVRVRY